MAITLEDKETGESCRDCETGEEVHWNVTMYFNSWINEETGEIERLRRTKCHKKLFQIPKSELAPVKPEPIVTNESIVETILKMFPTETHSIPKPMQTSKVVPCAEKLSLLFFILPVFLLFPGWATIIICLFELCAHTWSHKRNKTCSDSDVLYHSPLHSLRSHYCAECQADQLMQKIGKLQNKRKLKVERRKSLYCSYVERMSVVS